jgi:outer membrane protein TolC
VRISQISLKSARITLAGRVATSYFNIIALDKKLDLKMLSLEKAFAMRDFVTARFEGGLAVAMDLDRQDVQVADLQTSLESLKASRVRYENTLAVLLGEMPQSFKIEKYNLDLKYSKRLAPGAPMDILRARPDIQSAEASLAISHISYDLMRKRLYPTLSLSAAASLASDSISTFFDVISLPFRASSSSSLPIFDGGKRQTEIDLATLNHQQVITGYKKTILNALRDVESALSQQESIARQKISLARKRRSQEKVSTEAKVRFEAGSSSAINLLQDENALIRVQEQEVNLWLSGALSTVGLLKAFSVDPQTTNGQTARAEEASNAP